MMKPRANRGVKTSHPSTTVVAASPAQPHALLIVLPDQWIPSFHSLNAFVFALCFTHIPFPPSCFRACSPGLLLGRTSRLVPQRNTRMYCTASSSHSVLPPSPSPPRTVDTIVQEQTHTHKPTSLYCSASLPSSLSQHPCWCAHAACAEQVKNMQSPSLTTRTDSDQARSQARGKNISHVWLLFKAKVQIGFGVLCTAYGFDWDFMNLYKSDPVCHKLYKRDL